MKVGHPERSRPARGKARHTRVRRLGAGAVRLVDHGFDRLGHVLVVPLRLGAVDFLRALAVLKGLTGQTIIRAPTAADGIALGILEL